MEKKEGCRDYADPQAILADILYEIGNILIEVSEKLRLRPETRLDRSSLANLLKNFRKDLLKELEMRKPANYDEILVRMSKETIIKFVKNYYDETIPKSWIKARVIDRAVEVFDKHGGLDKFKDMIIQFQRKQREEEAQIIDVYSMEIGEIKKVLGEIGQTGGAEAIRKALPRNLRYLLKGVTNPEYAIRKVVDQITRLRAPISTFLERSRTR
jgi:hypothetical protein